MRSASQTAPAFLNVTMPLKTQIHAEVEKLPRERGIAGEAVDHGRASRSPGPVRNVALKLTQR